MSNLNYNYNLPLQTSNSNFKPQLGLSLAQLSPSLFFSSSINQEHKKPEEKAILFAALAWAKLHDHLNFIDF